MLLHAVAHMVHGSQSRALNSWLLMVVVQRAIVEGLRFAISSMVHQSMVKALAHWADSSTRAAAMHSGLARL
eukprot:1279619-Prymnesium_polylepis.1